MPISRREFGSGELDPSLLRIEFLRPNPNYAYSLEELIEQLKKTEEWTGKIRTFLAEHEDVAFTPEELWEALCGKSEGWEAWDRALDKLVEIQEAEKRVIQGMSYYAYNELPF